MDVNSIAQMSMTMSAQQTQFAASLKVLQAASTTMMQESAAIAETSMNTLFEGLEDVITGMGLGDTIDITV